MQLKIYILGAECSKCTMLFDHVQKIVQENGMDAVIEKITDTHRIMEYGIYTIPALVINDKVVSKGIVLSKIEIIKLFNDFLPESEKLILPVKKNGNKKVFVLFAIIIVAVVLTFVFLNLIKNTDKNKIQSSKVLSKPLSTADSINMLYNYTLQSTSYKITFLEFGSKGCIECKKMEQVMEEVKKEYKSSVNTVFYNVTNKENKKMVDYFKIQMIPVQVLLDSNGRECFRHVGFFSFNDLSAEFIKHGAI